MGGVRKGVDKADAVPTRGDIHCLLVGDPGLGKSQLLQVTGRGFSLPRSGSNLASTIV